MFREYVLWSVAIWLGTFCTYGLDRAMGGGGGPIAAVEVEHAAWSAHALVFLICAFAGASGAVLGKLAGHRLTGRFPGRRFRPSVLVTATVFFFTLAYPLAILGSSLASGGWISAQWYAFVFRFMPIIVAAPFSLLLSHLVFNSSFPKKGPRHLFWAWTILLALTAVGSGIADRFLLIGVYDDIHLTLMFLQAIAAVLLLRRLLEFLAASLDVSTSPTSRARRTLFSVAISMNLMVSSSALTWFFIDNEVRSESVKRSPKVELLSRSILPSQRDDMLANVLDFISKDELLSTPYADHSRVQGETMGPYRNAVLIVVDTLRHDAVPPGRPEGGNRLSSETDTPFLNAWIPKTFHFKNAYALSTITHRVMSPLFRSAPAYEDVGAPSMSLGSTLSRAGKKTLAVTIDYFLGPRSHKVRDVVEGFEDVFFYSKKTQHTILPEIDRMFRRNRNTPFFAWIHLYSVHDPGFNKNMLSKKDGTRLERYKLGVQWMDYEVSRIIKALNENGLGDDTAVVMVSDHGEGLGDNNQKWHGKTVYEEEAHIPLAVYAPGHEGRLVEETVGQIDVVPTIIDLLGHRPSPLYEGRSLVPSMLDDSSDPPAGVSYYLENGDAKQVAVVLGRDKLVWNKRTGVYSRYDLRRDPREETNLFGRNKDLDSNLVAHLVYHNPGLVRDSLRNRSNEHALLDRIEGLGRGRYTLKDEFILKLAHESGTTKIADALLNTFVETDDTELQLAILRHFYKKDKKRLEEAVVRLLKNIEGTPEEIDLVARLAAQGQDEFNKRYVAQRTVFWARKKAVHAVAAWLRLQVGWKNKSLSDLAFVCDFVFDNHKPTHEDRAGLVEVALRNLSQISRPEKTEAQEAGKTAAQVVTYLNHRDLGVALNATQALAALQYHAVVPLLRKNIADATIDDRIRSAMLVAIGKLGSKDDADIIFQVSKDHTLTYAAVDALGNIEGDDAREYLTSISKTHPYATVRMAAKRVLKRREHKEGSD